MNLDAIRVEGLFVFLAMVDKQREERRLDEAISSDPMHFYHSQQAGTYESPAVTQSQDDDIGSGSVEGSKEGSSK